MEKIKKEELGYFRLNLIKYLSEEHPLLLLDKEFVSTRSDAAGRACSDAIISGEAKNADEGIYIGLLTLYDGLDKTDHSFSSICDVIQEMNVIEEDKTEELAMSLIPIVEKAMMDTGLIEVEAEVREDRVKSLIYSIVNKYIMENGL